jgi:hypothetical protein
MTTLEKHTHWTNHTTVPVSFSSNSRALISNSSSRARNIASRSCSVDGAELVAAVGVVTMGAWVATWVVAGVTGCMGVVGAGVGSDTLTLGPVATTVVVDMDVDGTAAPV